MEAPAAFVDWLRARFDRFDTDAELYARCVLSILRERAADDDDDEQMEEGGGGGGVGELLAKALAPGDRLSGESGVSLLSRAADGRRSPSEAGGRRRALADCIRSVQPDAVQLDAFVDEIMRRHEQLEPLFDSIAAAARGAQNDSIDSGVCPSPEGSLQNYDEAFPPLSDDSVDAALPDAIVWPAAVSECPGARPVPTHNAQQTGASYSTSAPFTTAWASRAAAAVVTGAGSCPDSFAGLSQLAAPHFVVPKCSSATIGSCPTRLEFGYGGPPVAADLPCWLCSHFMPSAQLAAQGMRDDEPPAVEVQFERVQANSTFAADWDAASSVAEMAPVADSAASGAHFCMPRLHDGLVMFDTSWQPIAPPPPPVHPLVRDGAVPVSPDTHFLPIRAGEQMMVEASDGCFWAASDYFVLRDSEADVGSRSLPLKFKAVKPDQQCQTSLSTDRCAADALDLPSFDSSWDGRYTPDAFGWPQTASTGCEGVSAIGGIDSIVWQPRPPGADAFDWPATFSDLSASAGAVAAGATDEEDDLLLSYVGNISVLSPLDSAPQ